MIARADLGDNDLVFQIDEYHRSEERAVTRRSGAEDKFPVRILVIPHPADAEAVEVLLVVGIRFLNLIIGCGEYLLVGVLGKKFQIPLTSFVEDDLAEGGEFEGIQMDAVGSLHVHADNKSQHQMPWHRTRNDTYHVPE